MKTYTQEEIKKVKEFADKQFDYLGETGEYPEDCIGFDYNDMNICTPFIDDSARFELSFDKAIEMYGEKNVEYFMDTVLARLTS